ncbi:hypothetical protein GCM10020331_015550 [Ectobacillus funiculus]
MMARIGGLKDVTIHPVLGMEHPWLYRNKAQVPIGEREGGLVAGFFIAKERMILLILKHVLSKLRKMMCSSKG